MISWTNKNLQKVFCWCFQKILWLWVILGMWLNIIAKTMLVTCGQDLESETCVGIEACETMIENMGASLEEQQAPASHLKDHWLTCTMWFPRDSGLSWTLVNIHLQLLRGRDRLPGQHCKGRDRACSWCLLADWERVRVSSSCVEWCPKVRNCTRPTCLSTSSSCWPSPEETKTGCAVARGVHSHLQPESRLRFWGRVECCYTINHSVGRQKFFVETCCYNKTCWHNWTKCVQQLLLEQ